MSTLTEREYHSPRWTGELPDCSVPMTFDQYSHCSYNCEYCFSNYQKEIGGAAANIGQLGSVDVERVKRIFKDPRTATEKQFQEFLAQRKVMQWGGLSDPFDEHERKFGVGLELLRFFREIEYPITFSTKATWWTEDERYVECFRGHPWFNVKMSIISGDEDKVAIVEKGVPTTAERFTAMERASGFVGGGLTLRFRPFIIGVSSPGHEALIERAAAVGATAVSTEFFCLELRSPKGIAHRYPELSRAAGYNIVDFYKRYSSGSGYLRLNKNVKRTFIEDMEGACERTGLTFKAIRD